jgi:hypothetical protein
MSTVKPKDTTLSAIQAEISELEIEAAKHDDADDVFPEDAIRLAKLRKEAAKHIRTKLQPVNKYIITNFLNKDMASILASTETVEHIETKFAERNALIADLTHLGIKYTDNIDNTQLQALIATIKACNCVLTHLGINYTDNIDNTQLQALIDTIEKITNPNKTIGGRKSKKRKRRRKSKKKKTRKHY